MSNFVFIMSTFHEEEFEDT